MLHILIVDDDEAIAYAFNRYFEHHGFQVTVAYAPSAALELANLHQFDALVTDFRMPGMDGQQMLARLRQRFPSLPAVIVSGYTSDISLTDSRTKVVAKPAEMSVLLSTVKCLLDEAELCKSEK